MTDPSKITLNIKGPSELKLQIEIASSDNISDLKEAIASKASVDKSRLRLIYSGKVLKDEETVSSYKLAEGHTVHMVVGSAPKAPAAAASPSSPFGSGAAAAAGGAPRLPTMAAGQQAGSPLTALEGVQGHGFGGGTMNPFADMGQGNITNPDAMAQMMNSPGFLDQMGSMLQNPAVVDQIIAANPQLAGQAPMIRQMLQSEQFRSFLTNPQALQQMMAMRGAMGGAGGLGGLGGAGAGAAPAFPPPGAFGAPSTTDSSSNPSAAAANPFAMFGNPPAGGGAGAGGAGGGGGGMFGGMPMPTPEQIAQMQQMFGGAGGAGGGLGGMFGGMGGGAGAGQVMADGRPAHERYADQLEQLQAMGFYDGQSNIEALTVSGGNVSAAVNYLFEHPPPGGN